MSKFDDLLESIKDGIVDLAKKEAKGFLEETRKDGEAFLKVIAEDLKRWSELVAKGKLTVDEFEFLLGANRDLAKMKALKAKGLAKARVDRIVDGILGVITDAVGKLI